MLVAAIRNHNEYRISAATISISTTVKSTAGVNTTPD